VFEGGKNFDRFARDAMCGLVGAIPGFEESVHVGVRIVDKGPRMGEPITNGKDCSKKASLATPRGYTRGLSYSVPDFIVGEQPLAEFGRGGAVTRFNESFLVVEFKFSARALYNSYVAKGATQPEQFDAIAAYAGDHTYMHTALFIVVRSGNSAK